jgi:hypothetical protein
MTEKLEQTTPAIHPAIITNITVEVPEILPELFFLESTHTYGRYVAGINAGFSVKPRPAVVFLRWEASIRANGVPSKIKIDQDSCSYTSRWVPWKELLDTFNR